jgi:HEAT repeat protein
MEQSESPILRVRDAAASDDVDYLIAALRDSEVRDSAARYLGELGSKDAVTALIGNLDADDDGHRVAVAKALEKIGDQRAIMRLMEVATEDEAFGVRATAIDSAAALGDARAIRLLAEIAIDPRAIAGSTRRMMDAPLMRRNTARSLRSMRKWAGKRLIALGATEALPPLEAAIPSTPLIRRIRLRRIVSALRTPTAPA